ncbi:MAG: copper chaperone PCu(A)C [Betaproteobacteria bacterium]|jgi:Uncharacterized protein conserved in bacteria|nr:copper chaperone PCu(A)C [Betaproteobacteria bacterium]
MKKSVGWGIFLMLCSTIVQAIDIGDAVTSYRIPLQGGGEVTAQTQKQRVTLLHFWASWCVPCRAEMPRLDKLYQRYHAQGLDIVAIDMDTPDGVSAAQAMMKQHRFPWALADQSEVAEFGRIWRLPLSILIDRQGKVRQNAWAADDDQGLSEATLVSQIEPLLQGQATTNPVHSADKSVPPTILHAYARATAPGQSVGVVYLTLRNDGDTPDALEGADSPVADHIMLHQTQSMSGGMSHMEHEYHLEIPAHGSVDLSPGGHHLMLEDLDKPLVAGQTIGLDLFFQKSGKVHVEVPVMPLVPR